VNEFYPPRMSMLGQAGLFLQPARMPRAFLFFQDATPALAGCRAARQISKVGDAALHFPAYTHAVWNWVTDRDRGASSSVRIHKRDSHLTESLRSCNFLRNVLGRDCGEQPRSKQPQAGFVVLTIAQTPTVQVASLPSILDYGTRDACEG
jgi:hypothetical protein